MRQSIKIICALIYEKSHQHTIYVVLAELFMTPAAILVPAAAKLPLENVYTF